MTLYDPGATVAVVVTAPVAVFNAIPGGQLPLCATDALPVAPNTAAVPLTVSFEATFAIGVDAVPAAAVPVSATGTIELVTVTVSVTVAQFAGVFLSHN